MTASAPREIAFSDLCQFWPKQWKATETADAHKYTLFGGSRGPGKSYWLRWYAVRRLIKWAAQGHRGVRIMLGSEDYPALYDRHIVKIQTEFPDWLGEYSVGYREFRLADAYGGGVIALRNLDDPMKYMSAEFAGILIDELGKNKYSTFNILRGSLRWPGIDDSFFVGASNPTPNWVRDLWVKRDFPEELQDAADDFAFVSALPDDNPALDESYWRMLETLPTHLNRAWRHGDWFVAMPGIVYSEFDEQNLLPEDWEPDPETPIELAFDDGYVDPRAILFIQKTGTHIYVFDEIYESRRLAEQSVERVIEITAQHFGWADDDQTRPNNLPEIAVGSPEAKELQRRFRRADIPARHKSHKVVEGIKVVRQHIRDGQGYRTLLVHPRCRNFIDEITTRYQYPEEGSRRDDEKPLDGNDHACDAYRYWAYLRAR